MDFVDLPEPRRWPRDPKDYPMQFDQLPLEFMSLHFTRPTPRDLAVLEECGIPSRINRKYQSREDQASAFDGAFFGVYIQQQDGRREKNWLEELWIWYSDFENKDFSSPFYFGFSEILRQCGKIGMYKKGIKFLRKRA